MVITTAIRLVLTALLIWRVALGDTWALVTILILSALANEAILIHIRHLHDAVTFNEVMKRYMR